jgi:hypothetical protein
MDSNGEFSRAEMMIVTMARLLKDTVKRRRLGL